MIDTHFEKIKDCAKSCKIVQNRASKVKMIKNVHLKNFWTQFKIVHCQGPCSLRPCILRPYCNSLDLRNLLEQAFSIEHTKKLSAKLLMDLSGKDEHDCFGYLCLECIF